MQIRRWYFLLLGADYHRHLFGEVARWRGVRCGRMGWVGWWNNSILRVRETPALPSWSFPGASAQDPSVERVFDSPALSAMGMILLPYCSLQVPSTDAVTLAATSLPFSQMRSIV